MQGDTLENIKFGTDGWRGIIGFDFNLSNLSRVVVAACQELHYQYYGEIYSKQILIGYDRRFMASEFAKQKVPFVREFIINNITDNINNHKLKNVSKIDGINLRIKKNFWLLFRFSGTETLLILYCEAQKQSHLDEVLKWGKELINLARK